MEKIKYFIESEKGKDVLIVIIVILVGLASFELGRLSKNGNNSGIKIEYENIDLSKQVEANVISALSPAYAITPEMAENRAGRAYFASNRGKKYYSIGCSAGKTIKQENRVWFTTEAQAVKAGYEKSSGC